MKKKRGTRGKDRKRIGGKIGGKGKVKRNKKKKKDGRR